MTSEEFNLFLEEIKTTAEEPIKTERFSDGWEKFALLDGNYSKEELAHIAWYQGRKVVLLERKLKEFIKDSE